MYGATLGNHRYNFSNLATLLAKASPLRSGDILAGVAAQSGEESLLLGKKIARQPRFKSIDEAIECRSSRQREKGHQWENEVASVRFMNCKG